MKTVSYFSLYLLIFHAHEIQIFFSQPQLNIVLKYPCNPTGSDFHLHYKNLFSC